MQFQFLIGRLRAAKNKEWIATSSQFQFLIGRLRAINQFKIFEISSYVSIPHRKAKSKLFVAGWRPFIGVSIPHRKAKSYKST